MFFLGWCRMSIGAVILVIDAQISVHFNKGAVLQFIKGVKINKGKIR